MRLGDLPVDYSEPTQREIEAANASCSDLFRSGKWVSVNRRLVDKGLASDEAPPSKGGKE